MIVTEALSSVDYGGDIAGVNFATVEYKYKYICNAYNIYVYKGNNGTGSNCWTQFIYILKNLLFISHDYYTI